MFRHGLRTIGTYSKYAIAYYLIGSTTAIFLNDSVVEFQTVTGSSMHPTLSPDYAKDGSCDTVMWKKWNPTRDLERGDIVLFHSLQNPENTSCKRVVAVEGDTVLLDPKRRPEKIANGRLNPYYQNWNAMYEAGSGKKLIPEGHVWVEGDNWRNTHDSNAHGPISKSMIIGKAMGLVAPFDQIGSKPWENYRIRTKVIAGTGKTNDDTERWWEPQ